MTSSSEANTEQHTTSLSPPSLDSPIQELRVPSDLSLDTQLVRTPLPRALSGIAPASWASPKGYMPLRSPTPPVRPHSLSGPSDLSARYGSTSPLLLSNSGPSAADPSDARGPNLAQTVTGFSVSQSAIKQDNPNLPAVPTLHNDAQLESDHYTSSNYSAESNDWSVPQTILQPAQHAQHAQNAQNVQNPFHSSGAFPLPTIMERVASPPRPATPPQEEEDTLEDAAVPKFEMPPNSLYTLPEQRMRIAYRDGVSFTLMLVGESSSGKTTFMQMLLGDSTRSKQEPPPPPRSATPNHHALTDPLKPLDVHRTTELEIHECVAEENGFKARFTIVDTPGFGDYTNNRFAWVPITNYIDSQYQRYMCGEEQPRRSSLVDTRVHVCIYFLQPTDHKLLPLDITSMKEIGSRVNLVPVIAKADSLTPTELLRFKQIVRDCVARHNIPVFSVEEEEFPSWPYALVSSTDLVRAADGREVYGRQYDWGTVEVDNPEHSDLSRLKEVLMGTQMLNLIDATHEQHYKKQRLELRLRRLSLALKSRPNGSVGPQSPPPTGHKSSMFSPTPLRPAKQILKSPTADGRAAIDKQSIREVARRMTGLEILTAVSPFGYHFLEEQRVEEDPLYKYRVRGITNNFDKVIQFQLQYFEKEAREQERKRQQFRAEIEELEISNRQLEQRIAELESSTSRRKR